MLKQNKCVNREKQAAISADLFFSFSTFAAGCHILCAWCRKISVSSTCVCMFVDFYILYDESPKHTHTLLSFVPNVGIQGIIILFQNQQYQNDNNKRIKK